MEATGLNKNDKQKVNITLIIIVIICLTFGIYHGLKDKKEGKFNIEIKN